MEGMGATAEMPMAIQAVDLTIKNGSPYDQHDRAAAEELIGRLATRIVKEAMIRSGVSGPAVCRVVFPDPEGSVAYRIVTFSLARGGWFVADLPAGSFDANLTVPLYTDLILSEGSLRAVADFFKHPFVSACIFGVLSQGVVHSDPGKEASQAVSEAINRAQDFAIQISQDVMEEVGLDGSSSMDGTTIRIVATIRRRADEEDFKPKLKR